MQTGEPILVIVCSPLSQEPNPTMSASRDPPPPPRLPIPYTSVHVTLPTGVRFHYIRCGAQSLSTASQSKCIVFVHGWPDFW